MEQPLVELIDAICVDSI